MRQVAITGIGAVCSLGGNVREVEASLRESRSGIIFNPDMRDLGFKCQVYGPVKPFDVSAVSQRALATLSPVAQYSLIAALEAIANSGVDPAALQTDRTGIVLGSIMGGNNESARVEQLLVDQHKPSRIGGMAVVKIMNATAATNLAAYLGSHGRTYSLSSACATGPDAIGHAYELIAFGLQDICIAGATD
jgi:3-oxoacyl-[acyl-carrier-protein] synthase-1